MSINDSSVNLKLSGASPECTADSYSLEKRTHTGVCQQHPLTLDLEDERGPLMGVSPVSDSVRRLQSIIIISLIKRLCKRRGLIIPKTSTCPRPFHSSELESAPRLVLTVCKHETLPFLFLWMWVQVNPSNLPFISHQDGLVFHSLVLLLHRWGRNVSA